MTTERKHPMECFNVLQKLRDETGTDIPVQQAQLLMILAAFPGTTSRALTQWLNMQPAALSRESRSLSQYKTKKGELKGLELVEARPSLEPGRQFAYFLTDKGREVVAKMGLQTSVEEH